MNNLRFDAVETVLSRQKKSVSIPEGKPSLFFGKNVFSIEKMKEYLPKNAYEKLLTILENGEVIDRELAEHISQAIKSWAIANGATHYSHWFQPLTGSTAEKHDAFFEPDNNGLPVEKFTADSLIQQEPDASSFPNGGIRNTFEARGYTGWDPSSPVFLFETAAGKTLCIPTVFLSYTGEALDYKAPLLKSLNKLDKAAIEVCQYFSKNIDRVTSSLGIEQEYFLVDLALFNARPDLQLTGRTLFGHMSAKSQQMEDHYFGSIPERVMAFLVELEQEEIRLGIQLKTRHNEVAPSQFECA